MTKCHLVSALEKWQKMKARIKRVIINPLAFLGIMSTGSCWRVDNGIPKTAKLNGFTIDPQTQNLVLFVQDESFEAIDVNEQVAGLISLEIRKIQ